MVSLKDGYFQLNLTLDSIGRFLANNIIMFDSACLFIVQIQFSLLKKIKAGRREHSQPPYIW